MNGSPVQAAIDSLDRVAQLSAVRALHRASGQLQEAMAAKDEAAEIAARQDVERAYQRMQARCAS